MLPKTIAAGQDVATAAATEGSKMPVWAWVAGVIVVAGPHLVAALDAAGNTRSDCDAPSISSKKGIERNAMENLDVMVLRTLRDWRTAGKRACWPPWCAPGARRRGPVGSIMALCEDGAVVGSVSGGCIEDDLIYRHTQAYARQRTPGDQIPMGAPGFVKYGVTADEAHRFGLPCGGTLELLLEYDPDAASLAALVSALEAGQLDAAHRAPGRRRRDAAPATAPAELDLTHDRTGQHLRPRVPHAADRRRPADRIPRDHGPVQRLCRHGVRPARGVPQRLVACPAPRWSARCPTTWCWPSSPTGAAAWWPSRTTPSSTTWRCWRRSRPTPSTSAPSARAATTTRGKHA